LRLDPKRRDGCEDIKYNSNMAAGDDNPRNKIWTADKVIAGLKEFYAPWSGTSPPSLEEVNPPLHGGARRVFGTFKAAMLAAGLAYPPHPHPNETEVIAALKKMHVEGRDLSLKAASNRRGGSLLGPALHRFGSWRKAVEAAGIDYATVERIREWDRDTVIAELRRRNSAGLPTGGGAVQRQDLRLWAAARRHFGSHQNAIEAAGVPTEPVAPEWTWSVAQLQDALRTLHAAGTDLSSGRIRRSHRDLFYAARKRLGSWRKAIESIGLNYNSIRRARDWSQQAVIERLQELHRGGAELKTTTIPKLDVPLSGAIQRYFGTVRRALEAAGLPYPEDRSRALAHWTEEMVRQMLHDLDAIGHDLRHSSMKRTNQPLFYAAKTLFGSYSNAMLAAGIIYWEMSQVQLKREREKREKAAGVIE
jgi:hypothetical protein